MASFLTLNPLFAYVYTLNSYVRDPKCKVEKDKTKSKQANGEYGNKRTKVWTLRYPLQNGS